MNTGDMTMIALAVAVIIAFLIMILIQKKIIKKETFEGITEVIKDMPVTMGSGLVGKIYEYSRAAVLAVEQLVKKGEIEPDDEIRKNKAMLIVADAARVDDVPFGIDEQKLASDYIEANVHELPRNQAKVIAAQDEGKTG
jgi:preprotein translocase subunit YajC